MYRRMPEDLKLNGLRLLRTVVEKVQRSYRQKTKTKKPSESKINRIYCIHPMRETK